MDTSDLKLQLGNLLEPRGEWTPELRAEIDELGDDALPFMESCIILLEGKHYDD